MGYSIATTNVQPTSVVNCAITNAPITITNVLPIATILNTFVRDLTNLPNLYVE